MFFNRSENYKHTFLLCLLSFLIQSKSFPQIKYNFFISNSGSNANTGTSKNSPKQTLSGSPLLFQNFALSNGTLSLGLKGGDIFNETLTPLYPFQIGSYSYGISLKNDFAILNGSDNFDSGWQKTGGTLNTYQQAINYSGISGVGNYNYIYVVEIDKQLEKTAPYTARKLLSFAPYLEATDNIPGSFYEPVSNDNPIVVYIHPSDSKSPNSNTKYRYEVSTRGTSVFGRKYDNDRFENLIVRGYGAGYGLLQGGENTYCNKVIFGPGAAIHHIVLKSGTINHSLFLPAPKNTNFYAVVFYNVEGFQKHNKITNSIFLDVKLPIYSHHSNGSNYAAVDLDNVVAFADSTNPGNFMSTSDNDTVRLNNVYTDGYGLAYYNGSPKYTTISNSYFKEVTKGIYYSQNEVQSQVKNVFIKVNGYDGVGILMGANTNLKLTNSIIHLDNNKGTFISGAGGATNHISATGNIFISDVDSGRVTTVAVTNTNNGLKTGSDIWTNNVYILLKGKNIVWNTTARNTNNGSSIVESLDEWRNQSGQDKNSLFFDLRNDRRGLKAIFIDPENGDYELTNTKEGRQIQALKAGMTEPITCFIKKPTYEEAAEIIKNDKFLSVNSCKNPCLRNVIRMNSQFVTSVLNSQQIKLNWIADEQEKIDHFEIERATASSDFISINSTPVVNDTVYSFIDNEIKLNIKYHYRLVVVTNTGYKCYSEINTISTENNTHIISISPNPSSGKIFVSVHNYTGPVTYMILNSLGQQVYTKHANMINGTGQSIDRSAYPKGPYWLKVQHLDGLSQQKFVLQ